MQAGWAGCCEAKSIIGDCEQNTKDPRDIPGSLSAPIRRSRNDFLTIISCKVYDRSGNNLFRRPTITAFAMIVDV